MLDIKLIREKYSEVKKNLLRRKDPELIRWLDEIVKKDKEYRERFQSLVKLRAERNKANEQINKDKKEGKDIKEAIKKARETAERLKKKEEDVEKLKEKISYYLMRIPNLMHDTVPYGKDETENKEIKKWGKIKKKRFELKSHVELLEELGAADFERSTKTSGAGFYILKGRFALLNQALIKFAIDKLVKKGFIYVEPPLILNRKPYEGVTDLADFENVMYKIDGDESYLIATSEHSMAAMHMNEIMDPDSLPLKYAGYSMCFRREIGSHGVDTKGLFRTHQFNKVEQFVFCQAKDSWKMHEEILKNTEELFKSLEIPYRVVDICTGDLGIIAAKKYDVEAWMPRQGKYAEVASCSNCIDYQARRLNIRAGKEGSGEYEIVHTLNNTAVATSRALVAICENHQNKDGSISVPKVLWKYTGFKKIIKGEKVF